MANEGLGTKMVRDYRQHTREEADRMALKDIQDYLGPKAWELLLEEAQKVKEVGDWDRINHTLGFCGVHGFPVHAFGRRYCLGAYRAWMLGEGGEGEVSVPTDVYGYPLDAPRGS